MQIIDYGKVYDAKAHYRDVLMSWLITNAINKQITFSSEGIVLSTCAPI